MGTPREEEIRQLARELFIARVSGLEVQHVQVRDLLEWCWNAAFFALKDLNGHAKAMCQIEEQEQSLAKPAGRFDVDR